MKPLRLKLENIGPYFGRPAELDFTVLDPLFLVTGDTGAGKTTLFDGLCFALYGKPLGTRTRETLRSKHAAEGESTVAEFEFEVKGARYLAIRAPELYRPARKGGGWVKEEVNLLKTLKPSGWEVVASQVRDMGAAVEELLGLTHEEFSKILLLPQGEFQSFLEMDTGHRQVILQKLFPIQDHQRLAERAKEMAREATRALELLHARLEDLQGGQAVDHAQAEDRERELAEAADGAEADRRQALKDRDAARRAWEAGQLEAQQFADCAMLRKAEAVFRDDQRRRDAEAAELKAARRSAACEPAVQKFLGAGAQVETFRGDQVKAQERLAGLQAARAALKPSWDGLPGQEDRLKALRDESVKGEQRLNDLMEIGRGWRAGENAGEQLRLAEAGLDAKDRAVRDTKAQLDALDAVEVQRAELQARRDALLPLKERLDRLRADADTVRAWPRRRNTLEAQVQAGEQVLRAARKAREQEEARLDVLRRAREADMAAALAQGLIEGSPCPVCGSTRHPDPARPSGAGAQATGAEPPRLDGGFLDREQGAVQDRATASQALQEAQARCGQAQARLRQDGWPDAAAFDAALQDCAARDFDLAALLKDRLDQLAGREHLGALAAKAERERAGALRLRNEKNDAVTAAAAQLRALESRLGLTVADPVQAYREADQAHRDTVKAFQALEQEIAAARRTWEEADRRVHVQDLLTQDLAGRLRAAQEALAGAAGGLQAVLEQQGFASLAEREAARRDQARMEAIEQDQRDALAEQSRRLGLLEELERTLKGRQAPDLEALQKACDDADDAYAVAEALSRSADDALKEHRKRRAQVRDLLDRIAAFTGENQTLWALVRELDGDNAYRVKFSAWVLAWWLDCVLARASHRLERLSGGRYRFRRRAEGADRRMAAGLEIDVHDAYANGTRSVRTLSGGEKFLASLALALGMAEVIQGRSGGVDLDALFIDEGFGSLDSGALDSAMQVLDELGQGRMVGLISHLDGMKEAVPCQVRVSRHDTGSRLDVVGATRSKAGAGADPGLQARQG